MCGASRLQIDFGSFGSIETIDSPLIKSKHEFSMVYLIYSSSNIRLKAVLHMTCICASYQVV